MTIKENIFEALQKVEHPSIASTLHALGIVKNIEVAADYKVTLSLALPFPNIPDTVHDFMMGSLAKAAYSAGGELSKVNMAVMDE